jgi:transcriptional regulator with XRE-family HTH domain
LAAKLRQIRVRLGLTQEEMGSLVSARKSPVYPGHISEFESGRREPSLFALLSYARAAGVAMEVIVDDQLDLPHKLSQVKRT